MPPEAFILALSLTVFLIIFTAVKVAPLLEKPVEVLIKSTLASKQISQALTISFLES